MNERAKRAIRELKKNRNYSVYQGIYENNKNRMGNIAIEYRRHKITFKEMFEHVDEYALSLSAMGYKKGDEIIVCISNTPEYIYMLLAASKLGLKFNPIGDWFDHDYIEFIVKHGGSGHIFLSDDNYEPLKDILESADCVQEIVMTSLADSLPIINGKKVNLYNGIDKKFKCFDGMVDTYREESSKKVTDVEEFVKRGREYCISEFGFDPREDREKARTVLPLEAIDLEDDFLITYTSGSTNPGKPKATLHPVKSLALLARFKESDVSGMPTMKDVRVLAHIPSYVLANISTSITDPLYLGCTVIPEPIYDKDYFPYAIMLNKPNMSGGSVGFWRNFSMMLSPGREFEKVNCPYLYIAIVTGEAMGPGEEKFFNKTAREHKFGTAKLPFPLAPITFSIGGGTNEITGIFVTLFRALQEKNPINLIRRKEVGQTPLACADVDIIDEDGESVEVGEYGEIVAKTECGMKGYYYQSELDEGAFIIRDDGAKWYRMGAFGRKLDNLPHLQIKGRMKDVVRIDYAFSFEDYPLFKIDDIVARDTKNILSSSVVKCKDGEDGINIVIHVEPQPFGRKIKSPSALLESIVARLDREIPDELKSSIYLRYRDAEESFPLAPSGKRFTVALEEEGIEKSVSYNEIDMSMEKSRSYTMTQKK